MLCRWSLVQGLRQQLTCICIFEAGVREQRGSREDVQSGNRIAAVRKTGSGRDAGDTSAQSPSEGLKGLLRRCVVHATESSK